MITPWLIFKEVGKMLIEHWVRTTIVVVFALIVVLHHGNAKADELIMMHDPQCGFCTAFMNEVQPSYGKSEAGKAFPLTVVNLRENGNDFYTTGSWLDIAHKEGRWNGFSGSTPTFVVWKGDRETGQEVGRFVGYRMESRGGGQPWFYIQLDVIIKAYN